MSIGDRHTSVVGTSKLLKDFHVNNSRAQNLIIKKLSRPRPMIIKKEINVRIHSKISHKSLFDCVARCQILSGIPRCFSSITIPIFFPAMNPENTTGKLVRIPPNISSRCHFRESFHNCLRKFLHACSLELDWK